MPRSRRAWICRGGLAVALAIAPSAHAAKVIHRADLRPSVHDTTIDRIRDSEPDVPARAFELKMKAALRSPMHLKQTFPGLLGVMLKDLVGTKKLPGKIAPIGFDAHIENAGTVRVGKRSIQTLIDVDDSGIGPAGVDALSIGTALAQAGFDREVMARAFDAFAHAATKDDLGPREVKGPKWGKLRRDWIARHTHDEKHFKGMTRATPSTYTAIEKAALHSDALKDYELLDIAKDSKTSGGSGGLDELLLLARNKQTKQLRVYVMKEQEKPGVNELGIAEPTDRTRLAVLERTLWKDVPSDVFFYLRDVNIPGAGKIDLLVRDKLDMVGDVARGKDADKVAVEVARLYGREHAGQFGKMKPAELAHWMDRSTHAVTSSFDELWKKLKTEQR